jgi:CDP-glucose 4,6-dehydratase
MAELAVASYRRSFFNGAGDPPQRPTAVATVRAGNVIGGGDFTEYGLLADSMRSLLRREGIQLRSPSSTRPWQYVLEPLSGYLCVAEKLLSSGQAFAQAWNFGPLQHKAITTLELVEKLVRLWDEPVPIEYGQTQGKLHEAHSLHLSWDKSASLLTWRPVYGFDEALTEIVAWYRAFRQQADMYGVCQQLLQNYVERARQLGLAWCCQE